MLAIQGIPIFYLELAIGQRLRKGAIAAWHEVNTYILNDFCTIFNLFPLAILYRCHRT